MNDRSSAEDRKAAVEEERLKLEQEAARHWWIQPVSIAGPIVVAIVAGAFALYQANGQNKLDFQLFKAADVIFSGSPGAAKAKADALKTIFGDELPKDFASSFDPDKFKGGADPARVEAVLGLIAAHPDQEAEIIRIWKQAFPNDNWLTR